MTKEQIANFRKVLITMIGPYGVIMPDEDVIAYRDRLQSRVNQLPKEDELSNPTEQKTEIINTHKVTSKSKNSSCPKCYSEIGEQLLVKIQKLKTCPKCGRKLC